VELLKAEELLAGNDLKYPTDPFPYKHVSLQGINNDTYSLFVLEGEKSFPIEKNIYKSLAFRKCHPDAVYTHGGRSYYINEIKHERNEIHAIKIYDTYNTKPMINSFILVQENY
jgi:DEAD/DEAH box helicase domain-containing protein